MAYIFVLVLARRNRRVYRVDVIDFIEVFDHIDARRFGVNAGIDVPSLEVGLEICSFNTFERITVSE